MADEARRMAAAAMLRPRIETMIPEVDIVDASEIGKRLGVQKKSVHQWRTRHADFPAPYKTLAIGPVWAWLEVFLWAVEHGKDCTS